MALFDSIYLSDEMSEIFSEKAQVQAWLDVEAALARAQSAVGLIPVQAAKRITEAASVTNIDLSALRRATAALGWPILPLVRHLAGLFDDETAGYIHWGATTQDIMDTALILQFRRAFNAVDRDLTTIQQTLISLADRYRSVLMPGRTHGQHALPLTFGFKVSVWLDEVTRGRKRLAEAYPRIFVLQFGGAVGTLASLGSQGLAVRSALAAELGLMEPSISWHVSRERLAETYWLAASIATTADRIAQEVSLLMKTEVGELAEPAVQGRGGSSTMPQKRNPVTCELVATCAAAARREVMAGLDSMLHDHERGMGAAHQEWYLTPWGIPRAGTAVSHLNSILKDLIINTERMQTNIGLTKQMLLSEAVMMELAKHVGRQQAHSLMKSVCQRAVSEDRTLKEVVDETTEIREVLPPEVLSECLNPARYLGVANAMIDAVIMDAKTTI